MLPLRLRLTLWYFVFIGSIGVLNPFLAVVLDTRGATGATQAAVLSLFPLATLLSGPLGTWIADRTGRDGTVLRFCVVLTTGSALVMAFSEGLVGLMVATGALAFARSPVSSIADMLTVRQLGLGATGYSRIRAWGSMGFVVGAGLVGAGLDSRPDLPLQLGAGALLVLVLLSLGLPDRPSGDGTITNQPTRWTSLLSNRPLLALCSVGLVHQGTLSFYDHFYALHIRRLDLHSWVASSSIALGVLVEIGVLLIGHRLLRRYGPLRLIVVAMLAGIPRWILTGYVTSPAALIATQGLHGLGFGCWWVGGIAIVSQWSPSRLRNSAQGLFVAASHGGGSLAAMVAAGLLLDRVPTGQIFSGMTAGAVLALVLVVGLLRPNIKDGPPSLEVGQERAPAPEPEGTDPD